MSDTYVFTDFSTYYAEEAKNTDKKTKLLKILVVVLTVVLLVEAILYTVVYPCLSPVKVSFYGSAGMDSEALIQECGMDMQAGLLNFDAVEFKSRLESISVVESAEVIKKFPNQVVVNVRERVPVAFSLMERDGKSVPIQIDKNGVLFRPVADNSSDSVPLITGLNLDSTSEGLGIPAMYHPLLEQISDIAENQSPYFSALSEIHVVPVASGSYELVLYPIHSKVHVRIDRSFNEKTLQYMMVVLDVLEDMGADVNEVDMRYGTVSYTK